MRLIHALPPRLRFALAAAALHLAVFTAARVAFFAVFRPDAALPWETLRRAFYLGFKFDLRLSLLLVLPVPLLSWIPGINILRSKFGKRFWLGYLVAAQIPVVLLYALDFGNFAYLGTRVNATILQLLEAPDVALRMVWETYPAVWGALGLALYLAAYGWALRRFAFPLLEEGDAPAAKWKLARPPAWRVLAGTLASLFVVMGIYGKWSWYPLRWSDALAERSAFAGQLALNPVLYFADTLPSRAALCDEAAVREHYDDIAAYLGVERPDGETLNFRRDVRPASRLAREGRPNVVVIFMETFAAFKSGTYGNKMEATPRFDALARESLLFTDFHVPMENTSRSIFCALFGVPDVSEGRSSSRNPMIVNQHTILNAFTGYEKMYLLGGSAAWGNIRGMLARNIPDLRLYEEGFYKSPRSDVWGISDLHLLEEANGVLREARQPFFAFIQTAGNHRPYTIPGDSRGFETKTAGAEILKQNGFWPPEEYNALRFLDHSLGLFMDWARKEPYFENTIFVVMGDHGTPGGARVLYGDLDLSATHIPFLLHGPAWLGAPRAVETLASETDLMPTLAGLVGVPHVNTTLGRDLFDPRFDGARFAFTFTPFRTPPRIGLLDKDFYLNAEPDGRRALYLYRSASPEEDVKTLHPEKAEAMLRLCRGLHETAKWMLRHNAPDAAAPSAPPPPPARAAR